MSVLHIITIAALVGWILFVLVLLTIFGVANRAERIAEGWDEWDKIDAAEQERFARKHAEPYDWEYHDRDVSASAFSQFGQPFGGGDAA